MGSKATMDRDCIHEISTRIGKVNQSFGILNSIWKSSIFIKSTKIRFYQSNTLIVLLCGSKYWKTIEGNKKKLDVFQNRCLRNILKVYCPRMIWNSQLHTKTNVNPIETVVNNLIVDHLKSHFSLILGTKKKWLYLSGKTVSEKEKSIC